MIQQNSQHEHGMNTDCSISAKISEHAAFNVLEIWLDIVTDFKLGNLLWNKLKMEQEYPIICFQPNVKSLRELVYCYAVTLIQLQTFIITSLVI